MCVCICICIHIDDYIYMYIHIYINLKFSYMQNPIYSFTLVSVLCSEITSRSHHQ